MGQPQAFLLDVGGTLSFRVPAGVPTGTPTAIVYDGSGASLGAVSVTNTNGTLTATLTAGMADAVGQGYRVAWSYTVNGEACVTNESFEVVRSVVRAPCDQALMLRLVPVLRGRLPRETVSFDDALSFAWDEICDRIRALGKTPHRIIGPSRLVAAQGYLAAALVSENLGVGTDDIWTQRSIRWREQAGERLNEFLASVDWYDATDDLLPDASELKANVRTIYSLR